MALTINTNIFSLNAQRNLTNTQTPLQIAMQRLSSGLRINSAKDDAAGLAIATRLTSQIRGLNVAVRNANDGLSIAQTAEGAMDEVINNLQRMRELAVQALSGQYSSNNLGDMDKEYQALNTEIGRIADQTRFNDVQLLHGGYTANIVVSYQSTDAKIDINIADLSGTVAAVGGDITTTAHATTAMGAIDTALSTIITQKANAGAVSNRFEAAIRNISSIVQNAEASKSRIMDADFAAETANMTKAMIMQQAGISVLSQANTLPQNVLALLGK